MTYPVQRPLVGDIRTAIANNFTAPVYLIRLDWATDRLMMSSSEQFDWGNHLLWSEQLDRAEWLKSNITVTKNVGRAPDGRMSAELLVPTATLGEHEIGQQFSMDADEIMSGFAFVKKGQWSRVGLQLIAKNSDGPSFTYDFDTNAITASTQGSGQAGVEFAVEDIGDGWHRLSIYGASALTGISTPQLNVLLLNDTGVASFSGDGIKGTYVWGLQVVKGADHVPYAYTEDVSRGTEVFVEGQIAVSGFSWTPEGTQEGSIELYNENNSAIALVLGNGIVDVPVHVWKTYRRADGTYTTPSLVVKGSLDASAITDSSVALTVVTSTVNNEYQPNRYYTKAEGFNHLPPAGLVLTWGPETFVLEPE